CEAQNGRRELLGALFLGRQRALLGLAVIAAAWLATAQQLLNLLRIDAEQTGHHEDDQGAGPTDGQPLLAHAAPILDIAAFLFAFPLHGASPCRVVLQLTRTRVRECAGSCMTPDARGLACGLGGILAVLSLRLGERVIVCLVFWFYFADFQL